MQQPNVREVSKTEIAEANNLFQRYIFYNTLPDGRRFCTCSGCGKDFYVGNSRLQTSEEYELMVARHNDAVRCPHCKQLALLKNKCTSKSCSKLYEEQRVVFLRVINKNYVQAICKIAFKDYAQGCYNPKIRFLSNNQSIYTFRPNEVRQFRKEYNNWFEQIVPTEPFRKKTTMWYQVPDNNYSVIGLNKLKGSFLKYNMLDEFCDAYISDRNNCVIEIKIMSYFCRFCEYPQIEILQKLGYYEFITPLVNTGVKLYPYVNWNAKDLPSFFKLSKQEYKDFKAANGNYDMLKLRWDLKKLIKDGSIKTTLKYYNLIHSRNKYYYFDDLRCRCEKKGLPLFEIIKYLSKQYERVLNKTGESIMQEYFDYYNIAETLEYDILNPVVRYPKNLTEAHDNAVANYNAHKAEKEAKEIAEKEAKAKEQLKRKDNQYAFTDGTFKIIVPHTIAEIIKEGKLQEHCVGGYASRHMEGKLTICFLRKVSEPENPLYTIEMHNKDLTQVQGFKNTTPLTPEVKKFFYMWLKWVKGGSRRNKKGEPIIKNKITA